MMENADKDAMLVCEDGSEYKVILSAKDLTVYKKAYQLAMHIFELSKKFPTEERFVLISQIRRSSRSVCMNLREAWAKRRYQAHFHKQAHGLRWGKQ